MSKRIFLFLGVIILSMGIPGAVLADSILLGPHDFNPLSENTDYVKNDLYIHMMPGSAELSFSAPVHLPQGAKVTSVVVFYYNDSNPGAFNVSLKKVNVYTGLETYMAEWHSSVQLPSRQFYKISPITGGNTINNGGYVYRVMVYFDDPSAQSLVKLYAVKIIYTTT